MSGVDVDGGLRGIGTVGEVATDGGRVNGAGSDRRAIRSFGGGDGGSVTSTDTNGSLKT